MRKPCSLPCLALAVFLATCVGMAYAQFPAGNGQSRPTPDTRLNLGALGDINNSTPKTVPQRVLQGVVRDKEGAPAKGAIVYLKNDKNSSIQSMHVDEKGSFRFVQLSRTTDYKVWAQMQDRKTPQKSVSSFETNDDLVRNLQLP